MDTKILQTMLDATPLAYRPPSWALDQAMRNGRYGVESLYMCLPSSRDDVFHELRYLLAALSDAEVVVTVPSDFDDAFEEKLVQYGKIATRRNVVVYLACDDPAMDDVVWRLARLLSTRLVYTGVVVAYASGSAEERVATAYRQRVPCIVSFDDASLVEAGDAAHAMLRRLRRHRVLVWWRGELPTTVAQARPIQDLPNVDNIVGNDCLHFAIRRTNKGQRCRTMIEFGSLCNLDELASPRNLNGLRIISQHTQDLADVFR
jgi:hypothetical protein